MNQIHTVKLSIILFEEKRKKEKWNVEKRIRKKMDF